ncbi:MAG TPA: glycosyl hydrolase family 28-related protein [Lacunisphaera sp.]|nr:glycosyl hydrolase family 28-related protein [Lacunisphaera sp.]
MKAPRPVIGGLRTGRGHRAFLALLLFAAAHPASAHVGADIPWTTIEAESIRTTGTALGPAYAPHRVETESSGQRCVRLARAGESVEFTADAAYDALVIRYNLPDAMGGGGLPSALDLMVNGHPVRHLPLSSSQAWLYGDYPFSNDPMKGNPRNFYDELRVKGVPIAKGDVVRLVKTSDDNVPCILDLVDLELMPAPRARPPGSLSVMDFGAGGRGETDDTAALRACLTAARAQGRIAWVPAGDYRLTGDILVPPGVTLQGAGMWHTTFVGDEALYAKADRRVRFKLSGTGGHIADFAILGRLNYRNDDEPNDGVVIAGATDAVVARIWVEHTKAGVWVYNGTNLVIDSCRFRDLLADGVNFCVGTNHSVVQNCTARGTGDDCFAIWPVPSDQGHDELATKPGYNVFRHSNGQLPFLANGGSIYGGANNRIEDCLFTDITAGCGILISSTFPTTDEARKIDNNFSGTTVVQGCRLIRCGGYDHQWAWRGALQVCLDRRSIAGLNVSGVEIRDSLSDAIAIIAPGAAQGHGRLEDTVLKNVAVDVVGLGVDGRHGLWIRNDVSGGLVLAGTHVADVKNESDRFRIDVRPE